MGGRGSGNRWHVGAKSTVDDFLRLDVRQLARARVLRPGYSGRWQWAESGETVAWVEVLVQQDRVILDYRHRSGDEPWKHEHYFVLIVRTPCRFGGSRAWFVCPATGCGRRVAILYGAEIFACGRCHQLAYPSAPEDAGERAIRRANELRTRLGWEPGIANSAGGKPKWMRWHTFNRLANEHDRLVQRGIGALALKLESR